MTADVMLGSAPLLHRAEVKMSSLQERYRGYKELFTLSPRRLRRVYEAFLEEAQNGLNMRMQHPHEWKPELSSMMYLDACIDFVPSGKEQGVFYAVDFGGTNLRAVRAEFDGKGALSLKAKKQSIRDSQISSTRPKGLLDKTATATMLFNEIAEAVHGLMEEEGDLALKDVGVGFTFSFGIDQRKLDSAILTGWTKEFETGMETNDPVIGSDVCTLLNVAFARKNTSAKVLAALNDTVGTMLSAAYTKSRELPPCLVGVILGTGMNGCYVQPDAKEYGFQGVVINTELGGFNKELPLTDIDLEIDFNSSCVGRQFLEKMVSGMYINEVCRLLILRVFQKSAPALAWHPNSFVTAELAKILNDDPAVLAVSRRVLKDVWNWDTPHVGIVYDLVLLAFNRSAALSAATIAGMAKKTGRLQPAMGGLTVGVDGTLYTSNKIYQRMIAEHLQSVLGEETAALIHFAEADDGSGKGAAILAASVAFIQRNRRF